MSTGSPSAFGPGVSPSLYRRSHDPDAQRHAEEVASETATTEEAAETTNQTKPVPGQPITAVSRPKLPGGKYMNRTIPQDAQFHELPLFWQEQIKKLRQENHSLRTRLRATRTRPNRRVH
ncbi:hypothetical protein JHV675_24830 [Mycobacterium avium subsp. hominissuis]